MLTTFYPPWNFGGDGIQVQRLAHALADRGHQVTVVCSPKVHRILSRQQLPTPRDHPGVELVPIADGVASLAGEYLSGRPLGARRQLEQLLGRGFDVLHFHNPSLLGAPAVLGMGAGLKLYTAHEQWLLCPSHVLWKRSGRVCDDPPCRSCEITHLRPPQPWRWSSLLERSTRHLDALIFPSRTSARLHERFTSLVRGEVINHFVPDPPPGAGDRQAAEPGVPPQPFFLYAGRLERIKGVGGLIDAFRERSDRLVIAGDGSLRRRLHRAARHLPHVHFTGWLPPDRLDGLYRDALAVVVPTQGHEAFGLVAAEALARGTPTILHRFGALEELLEDTGAGIGYRAPGELAAALDRIAGGEQLRARLGRRARAAYLERYSTQHHLRTYLSLIADLARGRDAELATTAVAAAQAVAEEPVPAHDAEIVR
jgi:glycosyltransferase involved in cell wall biosynthesis